MRKPDIFDQIHADRQSGKTHALGKVVAIDAKSGHPIVERKEPAPKTPPAEAPEQPVGAKEPGTGRAVIQPSDSPEENQKLATEGLEEILPALKKIIASIPGAKLEKTRPQKDPQRTGEKIQDEGKPAATVPDYAAVRVSIDSLEDNDKLVEAIKKQFPVAKEKNELEKGSSDEGFHAMALQVQAPNKATIEVQVLPKEVSDIAEDTHPTYVKARSGDKAAQDDLKQQNSAAMDKFTERNAEPKGEAKAPDEKEHKFKFGNTQANIPAGSDAHKAIKAMQAKIPDEHLAGKGKDVDEPHVTVRYGIKGDDTAGIKDYVRKQQPFEAKLGKTGVFPPSESSDGAAVVHAPVESPELHRMNGEIQKHGDFESPSFPDYKPHVTVAYIKPEHAQKYAGMKDGEGKSFKVGSVAISDRDGNKEDVPMEAGKQGRLAKGQHVLLPDSRSATVDFHDSRLTGNARVTADDGERIQSIPGKKLTAVTSVKATPNVPHISVDLDGTLAKAGKFQGPTVIGAPIPEMVDKVKAMLAKGEDVRILTARVADDPQGKATRAIEAWSQRYLGQVLPIGNIKDEHAKAIYDDHAVAVEKNTGKVLGGKQNEELRSDSVQQVKKETAPAAGNERDAVQPTNGSGSTDALRSALASRKPKEEKGELVQMKPPKGHTVVSQHFRKLPK